MEGGWGQVKVGDNGGVCFEKDNLLQVRRVGALLWKYIRG